MLGFGTLICSGKLSVFHISLSNPKENRHLALHPRYLAISLSVCQISFPSSFSPPPPPSVSFTCLCVSCSFFLMLFLTLSLFRALSLPLRDYSCIDGSNSITKIVQFYLINMTRNARDCSRSSITVNQNYG